ncbi:hypothetical protein EIL50_03680 [bacterium NHP-B]|nr:hypothetical protein EIL50_03680 [bacterium NHP-B]
MINFYIILLLSLWVKVFALAEVWGTKEASDKTGDLVAFTLRAEPHTSSLLSSFSLSMHTSPANRPHIRSEVSYTLFKGLDTTHLSHHYALDPPPHLETPCDAFEALKHCIESVVSFFADHAPEHRPFTPIHADILRNLDLQPWVMIYGDLKKPIKHAEQVSHLSLKPAFCKEINLAGYPNITTLELPVTLESVHVEPVVGIKTLKLSINHPHTLLPSWLSCFAHTQTLSLAIYPYREFDPAVSFITLNASLQDMPALHTLHAGHADFYPQWREDTSRQEHYSFHGIIPSHGCAELFCLDAMYREGPFYFDCATYSTFPQCQRPWRLPMAPYREYVAFDALLPSEKKAPPQATEPKEGSLLESLPEELLQNIMFYLCKKDRRQLRATCRYFLPRCGDVFHNAVTVSFMPQQSRINRRFLKTLRFQNRQGKILHQCKVRDSFPLTHLGQNIFKIDFSWYSQNAHTPCLVYKNFYIKSFGEEVKSIVRGSQKRIKPSQVAYKLTQDLALVIANQGRNGVLLLNHILSGSPPNPLRPTAYMLKATGWKSFLPHEEPVP